MTGPWRPAPQPSADPSDAVSSLHTNKYTMYTRKRVPDLRESALRPRAAASTAGWSPTTPSLQKLLDSSGYAYVSFKIMIMARGCVDAEVYSLAKFAQPCCQSLRFGGTRHVIGPCRQEIVKARTDARFDVSRELWRHARGSAGMSSRSKKSPSRGGGSARGWTSTRTSSASRRCVGYP